MALSDERPTASPIRGNPATPSGMSADVIKLSDRRKVARPEPGAFKLSLLFISAYLACCILFCDAFVEASRKPHAEHVRG
jgi:hypothetical protein